MPNTWLGRAGARRQVETYTVGGTVASGSTFTVTINTRAVTVTATGSAAADAATLLAAALEDSDYGEFAEIEFEAAGAVVTATGPEDGAPFTTAVAAGGSGSPTLTKATVTSPTGPNWWSDANNWSGGAAPVSTDDVVLAGSVPILYGLAQSAVQLAGLTALDNWLGTVGLPDENPGGYREYRATHLAVGADAVLIDAPSCTRFRLNTGTNAAAITVHDSGRAGPGEWAVDLLADDAATTVVVTRGQVGVAAGSGTTSTVASVRTAFRERLDSDAEVELGAGLTVVTVEQTGGRLVQRCGCTTLTREGGTHNRYGPGAVTTWNNHGGTADDFGTGTVTTLNQAAVWTRRGLAPLTVTDANLYPSSSGVAATNDRSGVVTWTNAVQFIRCGPPAAPGDTENQPPSVHYFNFGYARKMTPVDV